ncbi:hypothetical protein IscW_ISCW002581 [Ixodes scapularis]|uniref:Uncharacterized protein n=1 Tax=Ixodes scapularis TaxID=6945 RepID=B7P7R1_IXOSC|nr:hypothetical protein IscW_ISCW002581 [Ixodes scapularis]|eukprot:XP_002399461.1 hypothetical protein IscW_ISCW002581 [Ixodes scapularis]
MFRDGHALWMPLREIFLKTRRAFPRSRQLSGVSLTFRRRTSAGRPTDIRNVSADLGAPNGAHGGLVNQPNGKWLPPRTVARMPLGRAERRGKAAAARRRVNALARREMLPD